MELRYLFSYCHHEYFSVAPVSSAFPLSSLTSPNLHDQVSFSVRCVSVTNVDAQILLRTQIFNPLKGNVNRHCGSLTMTKLNLLSSFSFPFFCNSMPSTRVKPKTIMITIIIAILNVNCSKR